MVGKVWEYGISWQVEIGMEEGSWPALPSSATLDLLGANRSHNDGPELARRAPNPLALAQVYN